MAQSLVSLQIKTTDTDGEDVTFTVGYVNPALLQESDRGAAKIDACARAIMNLSKNAYVDTLIVTTESVSEILDN